jgi:hypothetical protein
MCTSTDQCVLTCTVQSHRVAMTLAVRTNVFCRVMHNLQAQNKFAFCKMFYYFSPKCCLIINGDGVMTVYHLLEGTFLSLNHLSDVLSEVKQPSG